MKCLVTGGAGFIGTNLIERLLKDGHEVISFDNYSTGYKENEIEGCRYGATDIREDYKLINTFSPRSILGYKPILRGEVAAIYAKKTDCENAILLNTDENVIETTNSNIFILKSNKFYTPPITDGCVDGTMRKWILQEEKVIEKSLLISDINQADEVFLSNATKGITPVKIVSSNETIEYKTTTAKKLQEKLISLSLGL